MKLSFTYIHPHPPNPDKHILFLDQGKLLQINLSILTFLVPSSICINSEIPTVCDTLFLLCSWTCHKPRISLIISWGNCSQLLAHPFLSSRRNPSTNCIILIVCSYCKTLIIISSFHLILKFSQLGGDFDARGGFF